MIKALLTADYDKSYKEKVAKIVDLSETGFAITESFTDVMDEDKLIKALKEIEILIVAYDNVSKKVIDSCPDLKLIASIRGGPEENVDIKAATEAGVPVLYTIGRTQKTVAEHTMLLMLALARPFLESYHITQTPKWAPGYNKDPEMDQKMIKMYAKTTELYDKTLGMVGLGNIGEWVAHLANGFGMHVNVYDPYLDSAKAKLLNVKLVDLQTIFKESDYVTVHARVTPETIGMIGEKEFRSMKPTACFINDARAAMVKTDALVKALQENWIRGAALDVFDQEPLPIDHPLRKIDPDKVIFTTHLAGFSQERVPYHSRYLLESITAFLNGEQPNGLKNPDVFKSPNFKNRAGKIFGINKK